MAGSSSTLTSREFIRFDTGRGVTKRIEKLVIDWVGDSGTGAVPTLALDFSKPSYLIQAVTNPGSTAPTDNYDITLVNQHGFDVLQGTVTATWAGQSVNSATGRLVLYLSDER